MYKQIGKSLILTVLSAMQIEFVRAGCTTWGLFQPKYIPCEFNLTECCGFFRTSCCSKEEKQAADEYKRVVCTIIVYIIMIGIIFIFIAFLVGWIYSCYLIAKQIQETPEDDEERASEVFSTPINDKPPSYNTCVNITPFKSSSNIRVQQNSGLLRSSQSSSQNNRHTGTSTFQQPHQQSNASSNSNLNAAYVADELPPYSSVVDENR